MSNTIHPHTARPRSSRILRGFLFGRLVLRNAACYHSPMKNLRCSNIPAVYVEDAIEEFNGRAGELGIVSEKDLVSVSVLPATSPIKINNKNAPYEVVFVFWSTHPA